MNRFARGFRSHYQINCFTLQSGFGLSGHSIRGISLVFTEKGKPLFFNCMEYSLRGHLERQQNTCSKAAINWMAMKDLKCSFSAGNQVRVESGIFGCLNMSDL